MTRTYGLGWWIVVPIAMATAGGCGPTEDPGQPAPAGQPSAASLASQPATAVIVDGSSTVFRISKAAQEMFNVVDSEITVVVDNHGTGGGFQRYLDGEVDIVDASRPAKADEEAKAKAQGIDWAGFIVGYDGITLVTNPKNDFVKSLTVDQLKAIWAPESKVKTWKDINPAWPARSIVFYSPDNASGTFEFFTEAVVGKQKSQRDDVQPSSDDNTLVSGVAGDPDGLGYFGYAYFAANKDKLNAVAVQNGPTAKPVLPSPATIADKTYAPLSRPLFIYVKKSAARRPEVAKFLKFYIEKNDELAVKGGYNPPTADDKTANHETLAKLVPAGEKK
jgi:phosphate transport system substrate-binding protein